MNRVDLIFVFLFVVTLVFVKYKDGYKQDETNISVSKVKEQSLPEESSEEDESMFVLFKNILANRDWPLLFFTTSIKYPVSEKIKLT